MAVRDAVHGGDWADRNRVSRLRAGTARGMAGNEHTGDRGGAGDLFGITGGGGAAWLARGQVGKQRRVAMHPADAGPADSDAVCGGVARGAGGLSPAAVGDPTADFVQPERVRENGVWRVGELGVCGDLRRRVAGAGENLYEVDSRGGAGDC